MCVLYLYVDLYLYLTTSISISIDLLPFAGGDVLDPVPDVLWAEGGEAEARAAGLQGGDDLGHVVADQAEPTGQERRKQEEGEGR